MFYHLRLQLLNGLPFPRCNEDPLCRNPCGIRILFYPHITFYWYHFFHKHRKFRIFQHDLKATTWNFLNVNSKLPKTAYSHICRILRKYFVRKLPTSQSDNPVCCKSQRKHKAYAGKHFLEHVVFGAALRYRSLVSTQEWIPKELLSRPSGP